MAGAFGELAKDCLLYGVDTIKTRRQLQKETIEGILVVDRDKNEENENLIIKVRDAYTGFPIVLSTSIFQGGTFFLIKNLCVNGLSSFKLPTFITATVPIIFGKCFSKFMDFCVFFLFFPLFVIR